MIRSIWLWPAAAALSAAGSAIAQCAPEWSNGFGPPGTDGPVHAITTFDSGAGPEAIIAGAFHQAGGIIASRIARWDGVRIRDLGVGLPDLVRAVCPFDPDGFGPLPPVLCAGGNFIGTFTHVAQWNGSKWSALGVGVDGTVRALAVFDDGSGPALYAGGDFINAGGQPAAHVAKWDGAQWTALGAGVNDAVYALAMFDDGTGPALFAGGTFTSAGGSPADRIARWDGDSWLPVTTGTSGPVAALAVFDDGSGDALYVGGLFSTAGGKAVGRVARWDGIEWSALGSGANDAVYTLAAYDDGSGPVLCAGGLFTAAGGGPALRIARWDGLAWSPVGAGADDVVRAIAGADIRGPTLFAGGDFTSAAGGVTHYVAQWRESRWSGLGNGTEYVVNSLESVNLGDGPTLYVGGSFGNAGGVPARSIAAWTGSGWAGLGAGTDGTVSAITGFTDDDGPALYAAGLFNNAGGLPAKNVARWDGQAWSAVGSGLGSWTRALAAFDDGTGASLYAGGAFGIRRWDGQSWAGVGGGVNGGVWALAVFDDGSGDALYAGGDFSTAGQVAALRIAKWNGSSWSKLGGGISGVVLALAGVEVGGSSALFAGGQFSTADGLPASAIARWNGLSWSSLSTGMEQGDPPSVHALKGADLGEGPVLYAGGVFGRAGGVTVSHIARWDGSSWTGLGQGVDLYVNALASLTADDQASLFAGGVFTVAGPTPSAYIARWSCPPPPPTLDLCESALLFAPSADPSDFLGQSASLYVDTLIVGAFGDDSAGPDAGAAHAFTRDGNHWTFAQTLLPADTAPGDFVGAGVCTSGLNAILGAPRADPYGSSSGAAYIFRQANGVWAEEAKLVPDDAAAGDQFGLAVSLFGDTAIVGAWRADLPDKPNAGAAYIFARQNGQWVQVAKLKAVDAASDDKFGAAVALTKDYAVIGAPGDDNFKGTDAGAAYQFGLSGGQWKQIDKIVPNDLGPSDAFGAAVASDNALALIGAPGSDLAAADAGAAIVFRLFINGASKEAVLTLSDAQPGDAAGSSVAIATELALVGAPASDRQGSNSGACTLFERSGNAWPEFAHLTGKSIKPGDALGSAAAIGPGAMAAGASYADGPSGADQGAVLTYSTEGCPCDADFNADGSLDLFDFLAFVNAFNAANPAADCDHDSAFTLFDFLCFVNAFNVGC